MTTTTQILLKAVLVINSYTMRNGKRRNSRYCGAFVKITEVSHLLPLGTKVKMSGLVGSIDDILYDDDKKGIVESVQFSTSLDVSTLDHFNRKLEEDGWKAI